MSGASTTPGEADVAQFLADLPGLGISGEVRADRL